MTAIIVRWARSTDTGFAFVAEHVADGVLANRIADQRIAVAELDGVPVGAVQLEYLWGTVPYIALIRVDPAAQRRGAGRALLSFIATTLRATGHEQLYSSSQADEPEPQAWHRRMGFAECGIIVGINSGGVGEVFFVKSLSP
jgi:N-acetylglutamate synthase-like GNAT family acetyltransferase